MSITIENPTAESVWQAIQQLPQSEIVRLKQLLESSSLPPTVIDESTEWSDEDLRDFSNAGAALYEEIEAQEVNNAETR